MDDLRGRHQAFRMPAWVPEDEDMSDLAARMSHTPHFATMGRRGGPWRERRSSGGSAMSATSEDDSYDTAATDKSSQCSGGSSDAPSHEIPIRIEAPAPPTSAQQENEPVAPLSSRVAGLRKSTQYPVRTTSAVDASDHSEEVPRTTRCASAPPEMAEQPLPQDSQTPPTQQRFVSKINITPQVPQGPASPHSKTTPVSPLPHKFNTVPKPFVPANKQQQQQQQQQQETQHQQQPRQFSEEHQQQQMPDSQWQYQQPQHQYQQYPQQNQEPQQYTYQQQQQQPPPPPPPPQQPTRQGNQRPSVVRNIPIFVEGRDGPLVNEETSNQPKPSGQWGQPWQQQQQQQQHFQPQQQQHYQQQQQHFQPQQQHHQQYQPQQQQPQQQQAHQQQQRQQKPVFRPHPQPQQAPPEPIPQPVPMPMPQHMSQQQPQPQPQDQTDSGPQSKTQPPAKDSRLAQIEAVLASVEEYREKVNAFEGTKKNREFLYLDEMLTRALLQLDNIDPDGCDDVRQARRAAIKDINAAISALETKASEPKVAVKSQEPVAESMETDTNQGQPITATNEHPPTEDIAQQEVSDTSGIQENVQQQPVEPTTDGAGNQVATAAGEVDKKLEHSASTEKMETEPQIPGSTSNGSPPDDAATVTST